MSGKNAVSLLKRLIAMDSRNPGGDEPALARLLADELAALSPDELELVEVPRPDGSATGAYAVARWGAPRLLVNAHLDTVPAGPGWSDLPLRPRIEAGRVVGLGAADTKGAIAAVLAALADSRPRDLAVLFSGDEERTGSCVHAFLASPRAAAVERAIVCEPTGCRVGTRHRGILVLEATMTGTGGHSSRADELPAPVAELAKLAVAVAAWGKLQQGTGPSGLSGMCTNIARLEGGVAFNVVPADAKLTLSLRPPPGEDVEAVRREMLGLAQRVVPEAAVATLIANPSFATRSAEEFRPWLGALVDEPLDLGYWTEAAVWSAAGIDAIIFGPGQVTQAHAADEWVAIAELEQARAVFARGFSQSCL